MRIDIITLFPHMFAGPFAESMVKRAQDAGVAEIKIHNLRDWSSDNYKTVDDRPFGGGPGMILKVDVIDRALSDITKDYPQASTKKVLMSAKGKPYTQASAQAFSTLTNLVLLCGHYEGVDERVAKHLVDEEVRIGDFVLTGGELPAMTIVDSVVRLLPGVLGNDQSAKTESHSVPGYLEHPQYTRPSEYKGWSVPEVLLSGNHAQIESWQREESTKDA